MPIKSTCSGVKIITLDGNMVVVDSAILSNQLDIASSQLSAGALYDAKSYTNFSVNGPCLIGGGSSYDVRFTLNKLIDKFFSEDNTGCLLNSASVVISDKKADMKIHGRCAPGDITIGLSEHELETNTEPTRTASFYDFKIHFPHITYYVKDMIFSIFANNKNNSLDCAITVNACNLMEPDVKYLEDTQVEDFIDISIYDGSEWKPMLNQWDNLSQENLKVESSNLFFDKESLVTLQAVYKFELRKKND